jgi:hypothetical protein
MEPAVLNSNGTQIHENESLIDSQLSNDVIGINHICKIGTPYHKRQEAKKIANTLVDCITKLVPIEEFADKFDIIHQPQPLSFKFINFRTKIINNQI